MENKGKLYDQRGIPCIDRVCTDTLAEIQNTLQAGTDVKLSIDFKTEDLRAKLSEVFSSTHYFLQALLPKDYPTIFQYESLRITFPSRNS